MNDNPWKTDPPPMDREIEVKAFGYIKAFYQQGHWWWVNVDPYTGESYAAGPTPNQWRELNAK